MVRRLIRIVHRVAVWAAVLTAAAAVVVYPPPAEAAAAGGALLFVTGGFVPARPGSPLARWSAAIVAAGFGLIVFALWVLLWPAAAVVAVSTVAAATHPRLLGPLAAWLNTPRLRR